MDKRILVAVCCLVGVFCSFPPAYGTPIRNITTATLHTQLDGDVGVVLEDAFIVKDRSGVSLLAKVMWDKRSDWWNLVNTLGVVYGLGDYSYAETSFSLGYTSENVFAAHVLTDVYLETAQYLLIGGCKVQADSSQATIIPSVAGRYYFSNVFSLWAKYMFIYDTVYDVDNAGWFEAEIVPSSFIRCKLGGTVSSYHTETVNPVQKLELSALAGIQLHPWEILTLTYQFQFTHREEYQRISNMLMVDIHVR